MLQVEVLLKFCEKDFEGLREGYFFFVLEFVERGASGVGEVEGSVGCFEDFVFGLRVMGQRVKGFGS